MKSLLIDITNKLWGYIIYEEWGIELSNKHKKYCISYGKILTFTPGLQNSNAFSLTLCLNVSRIESLISQIFQARSKCFHIFGIGWTEKDKIFNPSTHSSTRLFKRSSLHMWGGDTSTLLAGLSKDQPKLFNVVQQVIACLCYESVDNFVLLQIFLEVIYYHCANVLVCQLYHSFFRNQLSFQQQS